MERLSHECILSIRLSVDGFSFTVTHPTDHEVWHYTGCRINPAISMTANLKQVVAEQEELQHTYRRTEILLEGARYTLVPLELFEEEQIEAIYGYSQTKSRMELVEYNILTATDMVVVFAIDKSTRAFIEEQWPGARVRAGITPLLEHWASKCRQAAPMDAGRRMYIHEGKRAIHIAAFDHRKPLLANSYEVKGVEDAVYYILNVWKQLGFDQEHDTLFLTTDRMSQQNVVDVLKRYVKSVAMVNPVAEFNRSVAAQSGEIPYDMLVAMNY